MKAGDLFKAGHLGDAITAQTATVRERPTDRDARYMLFVLLCFAGELERADKQLDALANQDEEIERGSLVYHSLLTAEWERRKVYEEAGEPTLPPDAPSYAALRVRALLGLRDGDTASAERFIDEAENDTPATSGKLDGKPFGGLRDDDDVLGTILEIYAGGRYIWMPLSQVRSLDASPPENAIDTLWRPARLEDETGRMADVHLPVLYQPSYTHANEAVRLGRVTEWVERGQLYTGTGQHVWLAVQGEERVERSLLEIESLEIDS